MNLSPHFTEAEMACPCCGLCDINPSLLAVLEAIRSDMGPTKINSGHRCEYRNAAVGGAEQSAHLRGNAADIRTLSAKERFIVVSVAITHGVRRIGDYGNWVHIDVDPDLPQDVLW